MLSEGDLVKQCVRGNRAAQREFYDRYAGRMLTLSRRYVRTTAEAEDVLQEGFLKAFEKIKSFRFESSIISWLTTIIVRTAINSKRQKLYMLPMVDVSETIIPDADANVVSSLEAEQLIMFIQELPDGCRVIFNLYAIEGFSHQEIAEMLKISEGTSKSQYSRARQLLREKILKTNSSDKYGKAAV